MRVTIDDNSGFCFGVVRAIGEAEAALERLGEVCSLGDIVHNRVEVQRLERLGLRTVTHSDMPELQGRHLFIRAHGEPPSTYRMAEEYGINVIDATCPVVAQLQRKVVEAHKAMREVGVEPKIKPIRGGTDGAQLSFKGLPCPNIFAGGVNFHSRYEFVSVQSMQKAMMTIVKIAEIVAKR